MRHIPYICISVAMTLVALSSSRAQEAGRERLQAYMDTYPQSQLRDVYKYCFQDRFGLEHLLSDSMSAVRYLEYELQNADTADWHYPLFHYPTLYGNYVRVDINYVRKGIVPMGVMVSAMLRSTDGIEPVGEEDVEAWRKEWGNLREVLLDIRPLPCNFVEDSEVIDALLASGKYAVHHSAQFNKTYHQHYRIVRSDVFEHLLMPYIVNGEW